MIKLKLNQIIKKGVTEYKMTIQIKMHNGKWRMEIVSETFEFNILSLLEENLNKILEIKDIHGRIKHD